MMKKLGLRGIMAAALVIALGQASSAAAEGTTSAGLKIGTLGIGVEAGKAINEQFGARVGANYFTYDYDTTEDGIDYQFDLNLFSLAALLDYRPFTGGFRLTGGLLYNGNDLDGDASPMDTFDIGDQTFTRAQVGTLHSSVEFNKIAPYLGIGYGTPAGSESRWHFSLDLGVVFQGSPDVDLVASGGTLSADPTLLAEVQKEEDSLQDDLDEFKYYPVLMLGATYSF